MPLKLALAALLGLFTATHVFVWHHRMPPGLYAPWRIVQWHWWWGGGYTRRALQVGGMVTVLGSIGALKKRPRMPYSARWATRRDLRRAGLFARSGVVLGRYKGRMVRHNGPEHVLCVGPTRAGKGTSHVIPTLRDWAESVVVHDPKMELHQLTAGWRGTFSRVVHFAPSSATSDCYNPLAAIRYGTDQEVRDVQLVAQMLCNPDGHEMTHPTARHFHQLGSELLSGLIVFGRTTGLATTLGGMNRLLTQTMPWEDLLREMRTCPHALVLRAAHVAGERIDRELSSLQSTVENALQLWTDPLVDRATSRSDFHLSDLRTHAEPMSLYLSVPFSDQERLRPLSRLLVRQVIDASTQCLTGWQQRVLLLIDEVAALRHMPVLAEGLDYLAGYGVKLDLVTPSLTPLAHFYGSRNNFWEGSRVRLVFAPNSAGMAQLFARETGEMTVTKTRTSRQEGGLFQRGTVSTETTTEPLLSPTALQQLGTDDVLLLVGNAPPIVLQQARYYDA